MSVNGALSRWEKLAGAGAEREVAEQRAERIAERSGSSRSGAESKAKSGAKRRGRSRSGDRSGSGSHRNRFEHRAAVRRKCCDCSGIRANSELQYSSRISMKITVFDYRTVMLLTP